MLKKCEQKTNMERCPKLSATTVSPHGTQLSISALDIHFRKKESFYLHKILTFPIQMFTKPRFKWRTGPSLRTRARAQHIRADKSTGSVKHRKTTRPVIPALWGVRKGLLAWQPSSGFSKKPCLTETGQRITRVLVLPLASAHTRTHIHHTHKLKRWKVRQIILPLHTILEMAKPQS